MIFARYLFCAYLCLLNFSAFAQGIIAKSENFVLVGEMQSEVGAGLLVSLEEYRGELITLLGKHPRPEPMPVRVYALQNKGDLARIIPWDWDHRGGAFKSTLDGPAFLFKIKPRPARSIIEIENDAKFVVFHEYAHHVLSQYDDNIYPRWYNEGFADYVASFKRRGSRFKIGRARHTYTSSLQSQNWLPMRIVIKSVQNYPWEMVKKETKESFAQKNKFYAQSWLAVHFLQNTPGYREKNTSYINLLNKGVKSIKAFEIAFSLTPEEFEEKLKVYFRSGRLSALTLPMQYKVNNSIVHTGILKNEEMTLYLADAMLHFKIHKRTAFQIYQQYEKAEKKLGKTPETLNGKAVCLSYMKQYDAAIRVTEEALIMAPKSPRVLTTAGMVLINKYKVNKASTNFYFIEQARVHLKNAIMESPEYMPAHYYYARTFVNENVEINSQAIISAKKVLGYYKGLNFLNTNLIIAGFLNSNGANQYANKAMQKAIVWSPDMIVRNIALEYLVRGNSIE